MTIPLSKEVCGFCLKDIRIGQAITECNKCDKVIHTRCYIKSKFKIINLLSYCENCENSIDVRYNPYKLIELSKDDDDDENSDYDYDFTEISKASYLLENCKAFSLENFNSMDPETFLNNMSTFFLNIDGNPSNFDKFMVELKQYKHCFSVIGLAETNISSDTSETYQIPGYYSFYQDKLPGKASGTGVALYIQNSYNATVNTNLSQVTENLETLFVTVSHENGPINIGVVYRPPSGNKVEALAELEAILENCPRKSVHILGDYNIDLHEDDNKLVYEFEEITVSTGFYPVISLYTHQQSESCKKSCIDNILTNDLESVLCSGTISNKISHHSPIFEVLNLSSVKASNKKFVQYYDYCNSNLESFVNELETEISEENSDNFSAFYEKFNDLIDKTCKLDNPKTSKRTVVNNPWITHGVIAASANKHKLHDEWKDTCSKQLPEGDVKLHEKFLHYRRALKHIIINAKNKYYCRKILEKSGDKKKTWEIINELRGKSRREIKPQFKIDNVKVIDRRVIANEFNKYFVSIATKMNSECIGLVSLL